MGHNGLRYVLHDGEMKSCESFANLSRRSRPLVQCPVCKEPVILKLGRKVVHHAAHQPGSNCALTEPETALHYNCKWHIWAELQKISKLRIKTTCAARPLHQNKTLTAYWDTVSVEKTIQVGNRLLRPDVSLWRDGKLVAGIEVYVTHRIEDETAASYQELGAQWVEVHGTKAFLKTWDANRDLPAIAASIGIDCFECSQIAQNAKVSTNKSASPRKVPTTSSLVPTLPLSRPPGYPPKLCCINCGNPSIVFASNSGPLCQTCMGAPNVYQSAMNLTLSLKYPPDYSSIYVPFRVVEDAEQPA